jgi:lipopolysaccharide/colanic/teichoic acid biosynthesis glycosyltransferase
MTKNSDNSKVQVAHENDSRITKIGKVLRRFRIDEFPQLFNVFIGNMSFVGVRPEVPRYVKEYTNEMMATLLLPAGITSPTSIKFKNEAEIINSYINRGFSSDAEEIYTKIILPLKMKTNLEYIEKLSFFNDIKIMFATVLTTIKK